MKLQLHALSNPTQKNVVNAQERQIRGPKQHVFVYAVVENATFCQHVSVHVVTHKKKDEQDLPVYSVLTYCTVGIPTHELRRLLGSNMPSGVTIVLLARSRGAPSPNPLHAVHTSVRRSSIIHNA